MPQFRVKLVHLLRGWRFMVIVALWATGTFWSKPVEAHEAPVPLAAGVLRRAPPLPHPKEPVRRVSSVEELFRELNGAPEGSTILIAPGRYVVPRRLEIRTNRLTLRGESESPEAVVLDGGPHQLGELLAVHACSDVVIANLTVENVRWNGIKLDTDSGVHRVTIYNCIFHNIWQRAIKGVRVPPSVPPPRECRIAYCIFHNDRPKTYSDDPADTPSNFGGNYVGGIDVMFPRGWTISDNVFYNIQGRTREGRGAVFLWHEARDCVVERNVIVNCDVGIALGNSYKPQDITLHAENIIVRNNFIVGCPESDIVAAYTRNCLIAHNTIFDPQNRLGRLIRLVHDNPGLVVANNFLVGPAIVNESHSPVQLLSSAVWPSAPDLFVDPSRGDLHLKRADPKLVNAGTLLDAVEEDFDGEKRDECPDIGADEWHQRLSTTGNEASLISQRFPKEFLLKK